MTTPLLTLRPSPPRLWFAAFCLATIGAMLLWIVLARPPADFGWRVFLLVGALLTGWSALRIRRVAGRALVLTEEALVDSVSGEVCRIADIERLNTGIFALKPARGFAIDLARPGPRTWVPGLWWRIGRSVGVGGMTSAAETRLMAEALQAMIMRRGR